MENILPAYNDPLFSILVIVVIALLISLMTYSWGLYKQQEEQGNLLKFLEKFDTADCMLDTANMPFDTHMLKPLVLLAQAFENAGEYHKSINIYLYLIKNIAEDASRLELMEKLGHVYLHAGFLERSRSIYEEILRKKPRDIKALYALEVVYEKMQDYTKAREVIEPLEILNEETHMLQTSLNFSELIADKSKGPEQKTEKLLALLSEEPKLYREIIIALFHLDTHAAWKAIDKNRIKELIDVLWFLPQSQLNLDIISHNEQLSTLYYAKGYIKKPTHNSGIFALDMLATAKENGFEEGDLQFSYLCKKCKQSFPVSFKRCPNCMALHSVEVKENIAKSNPETDYSLY